MKLATIIIVFVVLFTALIIWLHLSKNAEYIETYHLYYLVLAAIIWIICFRFFGGRFVRPKWKQTGKFISYITISFVLLTLFGLYALIFIVGHQAVGGIGHYVICKKHDIDFWTCKPEEKYLSVTEKWAKGDFKKTNSSGI
jgi:hypothetical protein